LLEALMYDALSKGKLPTIANTRPYAELLVEAVKERQRANSILLNKTFFSLKLKTPSRP
jgi:hypothetical protein